MFIAPAPSARHLHFQSFSEKPTPQPAQNGPQARCQQVDGRSRDQPRECPSLALLHFPSPPACPASPSTCPPPACVLAQGPRYPLGLRVGGLLRRRRCWRELQSPISLMGTAAAPAPAAAAEGGCVILCLLRPPRAWPRARWAPQPQRWPLAQRASSQRSTCVVIGRDPRPWAVWLQPSDARSSPRARPPVAARARAAHPPPPKPTLLLAHLLLPPHPSKHKTQRSAVTVQARRTVKSAGSSDSAWYGPVS